MTIRIACFVLAFALVGCKSRDQPKPAPPAMTSVAPTSPAELDPADGHELRMMSVADYTKEFTDSRSVVFVHDFPSDVSSTARAYVNLHAHGKNVGWILDGDPGHGFVVIYDENANGDLRDDPRHDLTRIPGGFDPTSPSPT